MDARLRTPLASAAARALGTCPRHLQRLRLDLADGAATTLHVATYDLRRTMPRVHRLAHPTPLEHWCRERRVAEAIVGGFFVRPGGMPLGELRTSGIVRTTEPFDAPWDAVRACLHVTGNHVNMARRGALPAEPTGDLLQAGPLLVNDGRPCLDGGGSTSLVCGGRLRNVPREEHGIVLAGGRPVSTVIAFTPR